MPDTWLRFKKWNSPEELGSEVIRLRPDLQGRDPAEIGNLTQQQVPGLEFVQGYSDIDVGETAAAAPGDWWKTGKEAVGGLWDMATSPIETGKQLGKMGLGALARGSIMPGVEEVFNPDRAGLGQIIPQEWRDDAATMGREVARQVSPAGIEERPMQALAAILPLLRGGKIANLGKANRAQRVASAVGKIADPAEAPFEALRLTKKAAGAVPRTAWRTAKRIGRGMESISSESTRAAEEIAGSAFGFTTGTGPQAVEELFQRVHDPKFRQVFEEFRSKSRPKGPQDLRRIVNESMDDFDAQLQQEYVEATKKAFAGPGPPKVMEGPEFMPSRTAPEGALQEALEPVQRQMHERRMLDVAAAAPVPGKRIDTTELKRRLAGILGEKGAVPLAGPEGTNVSFSTSQISDVGPGRDIVQRRFREFMDAPGVMEAERLHEMRKMLDDTIDSLPSEGVSKKARQALEQARAAIADELVQQLGGPQGQYAQEMERYSRGVNLRENLKRRMKMESGRVNKYGLEDVENQEQIVQELGEAIGSTPAKGERLALLGELAEYTGRADLIPAMLGMQYREWFGQGLVVRSEISSIGRGAAALVATGATAGLGSIPAIVLFSPKLFSEFALLSGKHSDKINRIARAMERMNEASGGTFRQMLQDRTITVANLMERLEQQGVQFGEEQEERPDLLRSLSTMPLRQRPQQ